MCVSKRVKKSDYYMHINCLQGLLNNMEEECVAVLTVLYKNNGAVSCVEYDFLSDLSLYTANPQSIVV